jgi:hypothetical protein
MAPAIFGKKPFGRRDRWLDVRIENRPNCDAETNTIFMN